MQSDRIKKLKNISTAGTLICVIAVIIYIIMALISLFGIDSLMGFANNSMNNMTKIDSNSPSAGYEFIAYLIGGGLGFLGGLFAVLLVFFFLFLVVYQIPSIISGLIANIIYKKNNAIEKCIKSYKTDGYIKTIMNGIVVALTILLMLSEIKTTSILDNIILLAVVWNYIAVFVLGIVQISWIRE